MWVESQPSILFLCSTIYSQIHNLSPLRYHRVLISGKTRTLLPASPDFLAILGLLLFQINCIIILPCPYQIHKSIFGTSWNWIEYMDKLGQNLYYHNILLPENNIYFPLFKSHIQLYNSLFSTAFPTLIFSSFLFRILKVTSRHQRFCKTLDPRAQLSVNASIQFKLSALLFSSEDFPDKFYATMITFLLFFPSRNIVT